MITKSHTAKEGQSVVESYKEISGILIDFFKTLGIELEFGGGYKGGMKFDYCMLISTGADVCYKGKKLIGSAQCRKQGYVLQHGSILFGYDKELLEKLFNEEVKGITCMNEISQKKSLYTYYSNIFNMICMRKHIKRLNKFDFSTMFGQIF